jgi:heterodisulfide reductase subunit A2
MERVLENNKEIVQEPRVGVFVCHCGGNISDVVDVKRVAEEIGKIPGVALSMDYIFMCSDPGQQKIKEAIKAGQINRVVVAACSPRLHEMTFRRAMISAGLNPYLLEQANIREQVSWVHKLDHLGATEKAIKLTRAAVEKVKLAKPLDTIEIKSLPGAVIVGAGVAGLRAAIDLAQRGSTVHLIEKTPFTGGNAAKLEKLFPTEETAKEIISKLTEQVKNNPKIILHTYSEVLEAKGGIGNFKVKIRQLNRGIKAGVTQEQYEKAAELCPIGAVDVFNEKLSKRKAIYKNYPSAYPFEPAIDWDACTLCGKCKEALGNLADIEKREEIIEIEAGAIIVATGFEHYEPFKGEYGYGENENIITLPQLIRLLDTGTLEGGEFIYKGKKVRSIGFIHCVGSRELEGTKKAPEERRVFAHCSRVCCTAILQAEIELKEKFKNLNIYSFYQDIRSYGRDQEVNYYDKASRNGVLFLRYDPRELPDVREEKGKIIVKMKDLLTMREEVEAEVDLLVLATGVHPKEPGAIADSFKLPKSNDRFLQEVHPKLRPVETAVGGIFLAGTAQAPFDTTETASVASAAAVKAAAILEGSGVHLEPNIARVDKSKCKGHGKCVEACPAKGAIYLNKDNRAEVNPLLCISCGNCVAVCPERACDIEGYEIRQYEAMIEAIISDS